MYVVFINNVRELCTVCHSVFKKACLREILYILDLIAATVLWYIICEVHCIFEMHFSRVTASLENLET